MKTERIAALTISVVFVFVLFFVKVGIFKQSCGGTFRVSYGPSVLPNEPNSNELLRVELMRKDFLSGCGFIDFEEEGFEWSPRLNFSSGHLRISQDFPSRLSCNQESMIRERLEEVFLKMLIHEGRSSDVASLRELINLEKAERSNLNVERKAEDRTRSKDALGRDGGVGP